MGGGVTLTQTHVGGCTHESMHACIHATHAHIAATKHTYTHTYSKTHGFS